ncbi:MAG TPA: hypothetical protein VGA38_00975 [Candidatus Limnocylindria bacterium]
MSRIIIARDEAIARTADAQRLVTEALAAFPVLASDAEEDLLPQKKGVGRCRICGQERKLTKEHIPPRGAFNRYRGRLHSIAEWLQRDGLGAMRGGIHRQDGVWGYTLCKPCNDLTGHRYAGEYREWARTALKMFANENVSVLDAQLEQPLGEFGILGDAEHAGPRPGAFVREVLALMCSMAADLDLSGRYPAIRRLILEPSVEALPIGMSLGLTMFLGGRARFAGPSVVVEPSIGVWRIVMEVAYPPLATLMVLATNGPAPHTCDVSHLTMVAPDVHQAFEGQFAVGFGHAGMPGDYRTKAMIDAEAEPREQTFRP